MALTSIWIYLKFGPFYLYFSIIALIEVWEISIFVMFSYPSSNISSLSPDVILWHTRVSRSHIQDTMLHRDKFTNDVS